MVRYTIQMCPSVSVNVKASIPISAMKYTTSMLSLKPYGCPVTYNTLRQLAVISVPVHCHHILEHKSLSETRSTVWIKALTSYL